MPNVLEPRFLGRRVTVRRVLGRSEQGRPQYGDVVGDLLELDDVLAVIDTRQGRVEVPVATIVIAKTAPPSTADELALEAIGAAGWRAEHTGHVGGWLLRASGGFTGRGNSVLPLRAPGIALDDALAQARAWYHRQGLPLRFQLPTEARRLLDAELGERGWPIQYGAHVMAARLDRVQASARPELQVRLDPTPTKAGSTVTATERVRARPRAELLTRHSDMVFASIRDGDRCVAIGRGAVDNGWLGVTAVEVDPARRRAGLAGAVMTALWQWGVRRGAAHSYLQVADDNQVAIDMYTGFGYWVHHDYRYRIDPDSADQ